MPVILQRHKSGALTQLSVLLCNILLCNLLLCNILLCNLLLCNILLRSILVELEYLEISDCRMTSLTNQAFERRSDYILKYQTWVITYHDGRNKTFWNFESIEQIPLQKNCIVVKLWHALPQKSHCKYITVNGIYVQWFSVVLVLSIELNLHLNWNNQSCLTKFKGLLHPHVVPNP